MSNPLTFDRPWLLLLLPPVLLALWAVGRNSRAGLDRHSRRVALAVRGVVSALLIFALAGTHLVKYSNRLTTVFLLDVSRSIRPDQRAQALEYIRKALATKGRDDEAGVIVFGRTSYLEAAPSDTLQQLGNIHASVAGDATDLASALRLADSAFPSDMGRKIVILSDGNENAGDAAAEVETLRSDGVRIDVAPTALDTGATGTASPEAMVEGVDLPGHVRTSAPFALRVVVSSTVAQRATVTIQQDGRPIGTQSVALTPGKQAFTFPQKIATAGFHRYDAVITPASDGVPENNRGYGYVSVTGRPRVLYVTDGGATAAASLKRAMAAQDIDIETVAPGFLPTGPQLASYDSVLLSDVPADEIGPTQMTALQTAVKEFGVGLGMIGGPNSFGAGRYTGTPIEAALPVKMDVHSRRVLPNAAVVVVLDASGSMAATEDGVQKVQLGARAAVQMMGALQPDDQVAVTAVTDTSTIVVPLEPASKSASAKTAIESVAAGGGGIACYQGLSDAYAILLESHAPIKHVILCADTGDSEQQQGCVEMAQAMLREHHITTTVCGIGRQGDQHVAFQRRLAHAGNGQLFVVNQAADLPGLFQRDVQTIQQSWFIEKPVLPHVTPGDQVLSGIPFQSAPPLLGYDLATAKPGATVPLTVPGENDPLFAYWRYGLGRTFAFTSDDRAHWAVQWLPWSGYNQFWAQAIRWSLRSNAATDFQTTVRNDGGRGRIVVEAYNTAGGFVDKAALQSRVVAPDQTTKSVSLTQTAPGRYEGTFDADQTGAYMVNVRSGRANPSASSGAAASAPSQTVGFVVPYSPEFRTISANLPLLTQLTEGTGGKIQTDPARVFRDAARWMYGVVDLAPTLLLLTALLFLADIALRRLGLRADPVREAARRSAETVSARIAAAREAAAPQPMTEPQARQLLDRRVEQRAPTLDDRPQDAANSLLSRRVASPDDPFPQVASLDRKPRGAAPPDTSEVGYADRLDDARRRAQNRDG